MTMTIFYPAVCLVVLAASLADAITCNYEELYKGTEQVPWKPEGVCTPSSSYSVREYYPSDWAVTAPTSRSRFGGWNGFNKLFTYISSNNIAMTTPVLNSYKIRTRFSWFRERQYQEIKWTGFYLNTDVRPTPKDPAVKLLDLPTMTVYVKEYSGYPTEAKNLQYLKQLKEELTADGLKFDESTHYTAGYDSPMQFYNKRNEVWLVKL